MNEADTCRKFVIPRLEAAGWDNPPHSFTEQRTFTDGRIIPLGSKVRRGRQKRADYLLRYTRDLPVAVVEAKPDYRSPSDGLQQAKDYAEILDLKFAYSTNGSGIVEFDFLTGLETARDTFPTPAELWDRVRHAAQLSEMQERSLLSPYNLKADKIPRYYQDIAINRAVERITGGSPRVLLTMATGTGKTTTAFQICWKLWNSRWNRRGDGSHPKILYLADRNILVDDPMLKDFAAFGDAMIKISGGEIVKSREIYFAIYQAIAEDERRPGLYREYPPDFFDLVIVDECHRGSARSDSSWREILEHFTPAAQLGMTATPLRDDNRDTYDYFGNPTYTYSLRQGIEDGFLAPYRVHRIVTSVDAVGWRPTKGERDRYGREIPDNEYHTKDFDRVLALRSRTEAIARHLTAYLKQTDRMAKTIVFCTDQDHADEMRAALNNMNADLAAQNADYVCRVTADEGGIGRGHLSRFQDVETDTPVILTTSQLLTTGVDAPTVKNVVLARVVGSMSEFKQIIGRGTRVRDDYGKLFFTILDYTGSATRLFADPDFDGEPARITEGDLDEPILPPVADSPIDSPDPTEAGVVSDDGLGDYGPSEVDEPPDRQHPRKFYVDGGRTLIAHQLVYDLDPDGKQLRCVQFTDYTGERVRSLFNSAASLRERWADAEGRQKIIADLEERGIDFEHLAEVTNQPDADPFDLLCHVAFNAPLRTRRERADHLLKDRKDFFEEYEPEARAILQDLVRKYADHGLAQFRIPDVLKVPPISQRGNVSEIISAFGGADSLRTAVGRLQTALYWA